MSERTHWIAVATALAAGVAGGASISKMSPALPFIQAEFGLSLIAAGWMVSMFNIIAVCSAVFFGIASDRIGALRFCFIGLAAQLAGGGIAIVVPSAALLLAARAIEGFGFIATVVAAPVLMAAAAAPAQRRFAFALWGTQMPLGGFAIIAASPALLGAGGWRGLWIVLLPVFVACIVMLALQARRYAGASPGEARSLASVRASLTQPVPWLLGAAFAAYTLQFYTVMVWLPTYLLQTRGYGAFASAMLTAAYVLANAAGNVAGSWLVHRQARRGRTIATVFGVTAVLFVGMFAPPLPDALRFAFVLAYGFVTGCLPPTVLGGVMHYSRSTSESGAMQGLIAQLSNLGTFVGPPIVATAVTWSGSWNAALGVLLAGSAIGGLVAWRIQRIEAREARHGP